MLFKTEPWKHQLVALDFLKDKKAALLHMDMGTGKTKVVIDAVQNHLSAGVPPLVLILCPKSVLPVWEVEFLKHCAARHTIYVLKQPWSVKRKTSYAKQIVAQHLRHPKSPTILALNYEAAIHEPFKTWSAGVEWDCIVLDESHRIKAPFGKTSKYCSNLRKKSGRRICLTGTPIPHNGLDIFAQFRFLDPLIFGYSFTQFKSKYAIFGGYQNHEFQGMQNEDDLSLKMAKITYQVKADDVLDLPDAHHIQRPVYLSSKSRKIYDSMEDSFVTWARTGEQVSAANALVKLLRLQQITSGFLNDDTGKLSAVGSEKRDVLEDVMKDLSPEEPLVVFCKFRYDIELVKASCKKLKRKCLELSGGNHQLKEWQDGKAPVLACQIQAGSVGVDMTRARFAIYYSLGFSLTDFDQSLARLRRPGAEGDKITYIHLVVDKTVDEKVYKALSDRKDAINAILDEVRTKSVLWREYEQSKP